MELKLLTRDENLIELLGNGRKYVVPKFQRDYSWEREQWDDLWHDVDALVNGEISYHYMGYVVLQPPDNDELGARLTIIDGQQRLTTLSFVVLSAVKRLREIGGEEGRIDDLLRDFIGKKDMVYRRMENRLILNRNNDYFFQKAAKGDEIPKGDKRTVDLMHQAIDYFYRQFTEMASGEQIGGFIDIMREKLLFTTIYIGDKLNAYKVFETLNARGVQLSSSDLLKNYIFSTIDGRNNLPRSVLDSLDITWEKIGHNIGSSTYSHFVLNEWNSRHSLVRKANLFSSITRALHDNESCEEYLDTLERTSYVYGALHDETHRLWKDDSRRVEIVRYLYSLRLFNITQPISLLLAVYHNRRKDFAKILKWICIFSMRYNIICRKFSYEQERLYSDIAVMIYQDNANVNDIKNKILELYPNDEEFAQAFGATTLSATQSNNTARYLLARLAEGLEGNIGIDEQQYTVEHILPLNPDGAWVDYFGHGVDAAKSRLGNMALVTATENKQLGQATFAQKQQILSTTACKINHSVCNYPQWNIESIDSRQRAMAQLAVDVWKIQ